MDDRLAGLLRYFSVSARVFHSGPLCGRIEYAAEGGYLHVLRTGQVTVRSPMHAPLTVSGPAVVFYPRAAAHVFITRDNEAVDLVCTHRSGQRRRQSAGPGASARDLHRTRWSAKARINHRHAAA